MIAKWKSIVKLGARRSDFLSVYISFDNFGFSGSNRVRDRLFYLAGDFRPFVCTLYVNMNFIKRKPRRETRRHLLIILCKYVRFPVIRVIFV